MNDKTRAVWDRMNESERFGCRFGLFPSWVEEYGLTTNPELVDLMKESENNAR